MFKFSGLNYVVGPAIRYFTKQLFLPLIKKQIPYLGSNCLKRHLAPIQKQFFQPMLKGHSVIEKN